MLTALVGHGSVQNVLQRFIFFSFIRGVIGAAAVQEVEQVVH